MVFLSPNFERLKATLFCGQSDRVPMFEVTIDEEAKEAFLGKPINDLETDLEFYIAAGYDYISLGRRILGFPGIWDAAKLENYYLVQRSVGKAFMKGHIKDWDDFKNYPWPKLEDLDFKIFDVIERILPNEMKVIRYLGPIFQMVWMLMGFENFCQSLFTNRGLVDAIWEKISQMVQAEFDDAIQRDIIGGVEYGDDIAMKTGLLVSPTLLREKLFPQMNLMTEACQRKSIPFIYHTDGDVTEALKDIIDCGVNALHPIDPTSMDIYEVKPKVAGQLCIIGNIDVELLTVGQQDEVIADTVEHIRRLAPGGGYVVSTSNSVVRSFKPENYRAMLETVRKYGTYPISIPSHLGKRLR